MADGRTPVGRLVWHQVRYQNKLFWRSPIAAFFTLVFPLIFLVLFELLFGGQAAPGDLSVAQFFAPSLAVYAAASATYVNLGIGTAIARDEGILKRVRGTPLPPAVYMSGRIGSGIWIAFLGVAIMLAVGVLAYDLQIRPHTLPAAGLTFLVGVAAFAALGLALAAFAPSGDSSPAIANATLLPAAFISDVFIPLPEDAPRWLELLGDLLPLKHFVRAFQEPFNPFIPDPGAFQWDHLGVMAIWGVGGLALALRFFSWEPRGGEWRRRRRETPQEAPS
jgi:ABC-2 type transport system permease protein